MCIYTYIKFSPVARRGNTKKGKVACAIDNRCSYCPARSFPLSPCQVGHCGTASRARTGPAFRTPGPSEDAELRKHGPGEGFVSSRLWGVVVARASSVVHRSTACWGQPLLHSFKGARGKHSKHACTHRLHVHRSIIQQNPLNPRLLFSVAYHQHFEGDGFAADRDHPRPDAVMPGVLENVRPRHRMRH